MHCLYVIWHTKYNKKITNIHTCPLLLLTLKFIITWATRKLCWNKMVPCKHMVFFEKLLITCLSWTIFKNFRNALHVLPELKVNDALSVCFCDRDCSRFYFNYNCFVIVPPFIWKEWNKILLEKINFGKKCGLPIRLFAYVLTHYNLAN